MYYKKVTVLDDLINPLFAVRFAKATCKSVFQALVYRLHGLLTASAFSGSHAFVLTKNHVAVLFGVQNTQQTTVICGNAAWRGRVASSFPVLRCCHTHDGVIAEAFWSEGCVTLSRAVEGVKREWSDDQVAEDVFGIYMQIAP